MRFNIREGFESYGKIWKTMQWLWFEVFNNEAKSTMKNYLLFSTLNRFTSLIHPLSVGLLATGISEKDNDLVILAVTLSITVYLISNLFDRKMGQATEVFNGSGMISLERYINTKFFEKNIGQHIAEGSELTQANLDKGINRYFNFTGTFLFGGVEGAQTLLISFTLLCILNWQAGLVLSAVILMITLYSLQANSKLLNDLDEVDKILRREMRKRSERWQHVVHVISNGHSKREPEELHEKLSDWLQKDRSIWLAYVTMAANRNFGNGVAVTLIMALVGYQALNDQISLTNALSVVTWAGMATQQVRVIARSERDAIWSLPSLETLRRVLNMKPTIKIEDDPTPLPKGPVSIRFDHVGHSFKDGSEERAVLRNISFTIEPGEQVALIGPSGSGKSLLMGLLQRYNDPSQGDIYISGVNLRDLNLQEFQDNIGIIPQKPSIFSGTVRENILYGLPPEKRGEWSDEDIWELMENLGVGLRDRLVDGLNTRVGQNGLKLSGGEAQRLMIVKAAIKQPRFMIIDEATSALDADTQDRVQQGIDKLLRRGVSAIVIAHRLSTLEHCNKFIVMRPLSDIRSDESQIEATASSMAELAKKSPTFRRLAELEGVSVVAAK